MSKWNQSVLYEVWRNGVLFRSFSSRANCLAFLAAARELCPTDQWQFVEYTAEVSGNE